MIIQWQVCPAWEPGHAVVAVAQQLDAEAARVRRQEVEPAQYSTVQHSTVQYSTAQYSTARVGGQEVEPGEQRVEDLDQLPRVTPGRQRCNTGR